MALTAGDRLERYEIISLLGTGGMGEVYFAEDTRLDRKVTLKLYELYNGTNPLLRLVTRWQNSRLRARRPEKRCRADQQFQMSA